MAVLPLAQSDFLQRAVDLLPTNWFSATGRTTATPGLIASLLDGMSASDAQVFANLVLVQTQINVNSAVGVGLDIISSNFFGATLPRRVGETDGAFRSRIVSQLFIPFGTTPGVSTAIQRAVGVAPTIFEPQTSGALSGGYGTGYNNTVYGPLAYNTGGQWNANPVRPYQCWITIQQPAQASVYFMHYQDIMNLVAAIKPAGTLVWVRVLGPNGGAPIL